ncbi:nucleoside 2-deoxyribosyltransferase [Candidatus Woesearchaeota archaeon]|nr:nucleoside 2-deoxyribosyltransferase [Candidatus Woesearchaeota archaeon]
MSKRKTSRIFISSKIGDYKQQRLNLDLFKLCNDLGFDTYLPQIEVPIDTRLSPIEILEANERAVDTSDLMLIVFDQASAGVAMEYQRIYIAQKPIIGYRSKSSIDSENLGMMLEGAWHRISGNNKSSSIDGIKNILKRFV